MTTRGMDPRELAVAVRGGSRAGLARAVTLVESTRSDDRAAARILLADLADPAMASKEAVRVGISGVPGVGKSTFIETLGKLLIEAGHRVGVLAVDPSSVRTGGSVLGDKTRMPGLAVDLDAYVRPSPSAGTLGGVTRATAQTITVLEAAGFDVVLVETVGVGQSEIAVAGMVDTFVLLGLARSGDQLQGIKKGVLEMADLVAINKADGDYLMPARQAASELAAALRLVRSNTDGWVAPVLTCSGLDGTGVQSLWSSILEHRAFLGEEGLRRKRSTQTVALTWALVQDELTDRLRRSPAVRSIRADIEERLRLGSSSAAAGADAILAAYDTGAQHQA